MKFNLKIKKEDLIKKLDIPVIDNGEQIVEKLEDLKGDDRLDAKAIKNLPKSEGRSIFGGGLSKMTADGNYTKFHGGASNIYVSSTEPTDYANYKFGDLWLEIPV
jgi:hypothetical protein